MATDGRMKAVLEASVLGWRRWISLILDEICRVWATFIPLPQGGLLPYSPLAQSRLS